ncbi:hypothetical protein OJJOAM_004443 [Cupriavidus sp. H18C1]
MVEKLERLLLDINAAPETAEFFARTNWDVFTGNAAELRRFQLAEIRKWSDAAARAGIPKQ